MQFLSDNYGWQVHKINSLRYHITLSLTKCAFNKAQWATLYNRWLTVISTFAQNAVSWSKLFFKLPLFVLTYLLTYSMVQSPSWEANWFVASPEIPRISRNPKVHSRTHKRPPPVSILGQPNPALYPHPTSWRSILILSTHLCLGLANGLFPSGFPIKTIYTPFSSPVRATCSAHLILLFLNQTQC
jgi:hypothetical protein